MENKMQTQELISALADGQLRGEAFARGVEVALTDPEALEAWQTYHLIGDVLRSGEAAVGTAPTAFLSKLQVRLRQEEGVVPARPPIEFRESRTTGMRREAANDASLRWKAVAALASVAAFAAISWTAIGSLSGKPEQAQMAAHGGTIVAGSQGVMIRDPRLDEFLAAHRQLGGASALQAPAGFLRNATFEGTSR
jgi:sigma-E factor negative regulatory protein RseA